MTDHRPSFDLDAYDRYLAGESSADEARAVQHALIGEPERVSDAVLRNTLRRDAAGFLAVSANAGWEALVRRDVFAAQTDGVERHSMERRRTLHTGTRSLQRYVATAMLMIAASVIGLWVVRPRETAPNAVRTFQSVANQRATIQLDDGSVMQLAPMTTAVVTGREVVVTGEAYFSVASRAERPFVVRTRNAEVHVLGTRFAVRQYPGEPRSRVVVEEGRVALQTLQTPRSGGWRSARTVLSEQMLAMVSDSGVVATSGITPSQYTSWTDGMLVFKDIPLREVVTEVVRAYGADIRLADTTLAKRIVGIEISVRDDSLGVVLESLCAVVDAHYTRHGQSYVISPGRSALKAAPAVRSRQSSLQPELQYGR